MSPNPERKWFAVAGLAAGLWIPWLALNLLGAEFPHSTKIGWDDFARLSWGLGLALALTGIGVAVAKSRPDRTWTVWPTLIVAVCLVQLAVLGLALLNAS